MNCCKLCVCMFFSLIFYIISSIKTIIASRPREYEHWSPRRSLRSFLALLKIYFYFIIHFTLENFCRSLLTIKWNCEKSWNLLVSIKALIHVANLISKVHQIKFCTSKLNRSGTGGTESTFLWKKHDFLLFMPPDLEHFV